MWLLYIFLPLVRGYDAGAKINGIGGAAIVRSNLLICFGFAGSLDVTMVKSGLLVSVSFVLATVSVTTIYSKYSSLITLVIMTSTSRDSLGGVNSLAVSLIQI